MKTPRVVMNVMLTFLLFGGTAAQAQQNDIEVPGDHFSLEGALELFKKSTSPEDFERLLNSPDSEVNNLDLNGDGNIDYIRVIDRNEGNVHVFILQAVVSRTESQDVAVIELEKLDNGKAILQITGDADIYGIETIIEPTEEVRVNAGISTARTIVNVWTWPSVQYVYSPYYYGWVSPWAWDYWPIWWRPWRPVTYVVYYSRWEPYYYYYSPCYTHRVVYAQQLYRPYRSTSVIVYNRYQSHITNYRSSRSDGHFNRGRDNSRSYTGGNTYNRATDQRGRPVVNDRGNSNNSSRDWGRSHNDGNRGRTSSSSDRSFENRGNRDVSRTTSEWQRNANGMQNRDLKEKPVFENKDRGSYNRNRPTFENKDRGQQDRSRSSFENRSTPGANREPARRQQFENTNRSSHNREVRPSNDMRGSQRSVIQPERRSSGSPSMQRSGNGNGGGNNSGGHKRGRD